MGRGCIDATVCQKCLSCLKLEEARQNFSLRDFRDRMVPLRRIDFRLLDSETLRGYISIVLSHQFCAHQPRLKKLKYPKSGVYLKSKGPGANTEGEETEGLMFKSQQGMAHRR